jgi:hypothetical protein
MQPANSATGSTATSGSGVTLSTSAVAAHNAPLSTTSLATVQSRPDCCSTRSSDCTRGTRSSSRSNGFDSSSMRFFRIDIRSCCTLPPADIARKRDSIRRGIAVPRVPPLIDALDREHDRDEGENHKTVKDRVHEASGRRQFVS